MKNHLKFMLPVLVLGLFVLTASGCDQIPQLIAPIISPVTPAAGGETAASPGEAAEAEGATTEIVEPTPPTEGPEKAVFEHCEALKAGDFAHAADLLSEYSLGVANLTRHDVIIRYETRDFMGWKLVDYRILESKPFDSQTTLVHTLLKEQTGEEPPEYFDLWLPLRQEDGVWRLNYERFIDDLPLDVPAQTSNGVNVQLVRLLRYSDYLRLELNIENPTKKTLYWDIPGQPSAIYTFGEETTIVPSIRNEPLHIDAGSTLNGAYFDATGLYQNYPDAVDLIGWAWADAKNPNTPNLSGSRWSYSFTLQQPQATPTP
jgi:hypothetical protein